MKDTLMFIVGNAGWILTIFILVRMLYKERQFRRWSDVMDQSMVCLKRARELVDKGQYEQAKAQAERAAELREFADQLEKKL